MGKKKQAAVVGVTDKRGVHNIDCIAGMQSMPDGCVDLIVADPPYNIGRDYDAYDDDRPDDEYLQWCEKWISESVRVLKPDGSMWVASYANMVSEIDVTCKRLGLHKRGHIIWGFTFGVNQSKNFTRAHTHWLYYTKSRTKFVFRANDVENRVPSARQLIYGDKRASPKGRLPDDVWILNMNQVKDKLPSNLDLWLESRVCGTFHERVKGSDNQIPTAITDRIIRFCSDPGQLVLDPFTGTGTTGVSAMRTRREFVGFELSSKSSKQAAARIAEAAKESL